MTASELTLAYALLIDAVELAATRCNVVRRLELREVVMAVALGANPGGE